MRPVVTLLYLPWTRTSEDLVVFVHSGSEIIKASVTERTRPLPVDSLLSTRATIFSPIIVVYTNHPLSIQSIRLQLVSSITLLLEAWMIDSKEVS